MDLKEIFNQSKLESENNYYVPIAKRKENLLLIKEILQQKAKELACAVSNDFSYRAVSETLLLEIFPSIRTLDYILKNLTKWTKKRKRKVSWLLKPAYAYQIPQPVGVVGIMVPWNYPLILFFIPLMYALAAGNRVLIKTSELTPQTGLLLHEIISNLNLRSFVTVINGGLEVAMEFASLPFNHLFFTGSTAVGKKIMEAASKNLTPVTLELGGKSPAIISKTVHPSHLMRLFIGKLYNAGQTCIAPDYLLIPKGFENEIENHFKNYINKCYPNLIKNPEYSSIISESHRERLLTILEDAKQQGARVIEFGNGETAGRKLPFFLIFNVKPSMKIMKEELFGPLLPIIVYDDIKEAIQLINSLPSPLVLYYFGQDRLEKNLIEKETLSGGLTINDTLNQLAVDDLPFGGIGESGMGSYHGREGFDRFSQLKSVFVQRKYSPIALFYPPHGKLTRYLLKWIGGINLKDED